MEKNKFVTDMKYSHIKKQPFLGKGLIIPLNVSLKLVVTCAHGLNMMSTCGELFQNLFSGSTVIKRS